MTHIEAQNIMVKELYARGVHGWNNSLIEAWKAKTKNNVLREALTRIQMIRRDIDEQQLLFHLE